MLYFVLFVSRSVTGSALAVEATAIVAAARTPTIVE
jgi:hypothetical protein